MYLPIKLFSIADFKSNCIYCILVLPLYFNNSIADKNISVAFLEVISTWIDFFMYMNHNSTLDISVSSRSSCKKWYNGVFNNQ